MHKYKVLKGALFSEYTMCDALKYFAKVVNAISSGLSVPNSSLVIVSCH
jgi:hypothetical protein